MHATITSPLNNPPEDFKILDQPGSIVRVKGKVTITDAGQLTDAWVNGAKIPVAQAAVYDKATDAWNLDVPVKLKPGPNEVDLTLFGGASPACGTAPGGACVGCAFQDIHFHLEWRLADASPSSLVLLDSAGKDPVPAQVAAPIRFVISVTDKSGDRTAAVDSLAAEVVNANQGVTLDAILVETGPRTGVFRAEPILAADGAAGPGRIALAEGDTVWVTYRDPTDPDDSSRAFLYSPATFPQAIGGWYLDSDADGAIDRAVVLFSRPLAAAPDSLRLWFPDSASARMVSGAALKTSGARVEAEILPPFAAGTTGFTAGNRNSGRAFLTVDGKARISAFSLADSAGPVLNRAVLNPASDPGLPDTLTLTFSEAVDLDGAVHPFEARRDGADHSPGEIAVTGAVAAQGATWILLLDPGSAFRPDPGDSLRLAAGPSGGARDGVGNFPATGNRRVIVEGEARKPPAILTLSWDLRGSGLPQGNDAGAPFTLLLRDGAGPWTPFQGSVGRNARPCGQVDCGAVGPDGSLGRPSAVFTADKTFRYQAAVFSNLGTLVAAFSGEVAFDVPGTHEVRMAWNGRALDGTKAGTGAYVWKVRATLAGSAKPVVVEGSKIVGLLRKD
jgi:hypothetical protein